MLTFTRRNPARLSRGQFAEKKGVGVMKVMDAGKCGESLHQETTSCAPAALPR